MMENLLKNKALLRGLLRQGDIINTINGGTVATNAEFFKTEQSLVIKISAPSLSLPAYNIVLEKRELVIFTVLLHNTEEHAPESLMAAPLYLKRFKIPIEVDLDKIEAIYEDGVLRIILPFNQSLYNQLRRINIKQV